MQMPVRRHNFLALLNAFCRDINPDEHLEEIPVSPEPQAKPGFCNVNVAIKVSRDGGEPVSGWDITWEDDGLLEAECHVVWKSPEGNLIDVTPRIDGSQSSLFLPHPSLWDGSEFIPNKRLALHDTPRCRALFKLAEMQDQLKRQSWTGAQWVITESEDQELRARAAKIVFGVPHWHKCPCGSDKKFGRCCGRPKGKAWRNF